MTLVVGTAGHIDHGKTTLLAALTGIDADRLPEERRRGMTLDVGYAHAVLDDVIVDFVDVPGHDRLVGNMLVGAGEIDAVLLVVAADDGIRPQTIEHLELLDALGLDAGVVAVTKADAVPPERASAVGQAVRETLARTSLAGSPVLPVSAVTRDGLARLAGAVASMARTARPGVVDAPRLAVDRAFAVRGRGTVVTGTLRGGSVGTGDVLELQPVGRSVRVREVQVHGAPVDAAGPGRIALNLAGVAVGDVRRGHVLAAPGLVDASDRLLVVLDPPPPLAAGVPAIPPDRAHVRLHLGTDQVDARVGRAGREAVGLDAGRGTAILRLDRPIAASIGDRFVLRRPSPGATAAGGVVLDTTPPRAVSRRRATPERLTALVAAVARHDPAAARLALHGALGTGREVALAPDVASALRGHILASADRATASVALEDVRADAARALRRGVTLDQPAAVRAVTAAIDDLARHGQILRTGDRITVPGRAAAAPSASEAAALDRLVAALDAAAPPSLREAAQAAGCAPGAEAALERAGRIVRVDDDLAWSTPAWQRLAATALDRARRAPLTPAALRDATGTSRKYVMALLEDLNRRGILVRGPDGHRPGPRAGALGDRGSVA